MQKYMSPLYMIKEKSTRDHNHEKLWQDLLPHAGSQVMHDGKLIKCRMQLQYRQENLVTGHKSDFNANKRSVRQSILVGQLIHPGIYILEIQICITVTTTFFYHSPGPLVSQSLLFCESIIRRSSCNQLTSTFADLLTDSQLIPGCAALHPVALCYIRLRNANPGRQAGSGVNCFIRVARYCINPLILTKKKNGEHSCNQTRSDLPVCLSYRVVLGTPCSRAARLILHPLLTASNAASIASSSHCLRFPRLGERKTAGADFERILRCLPRGHCFRLALRKDGITTDNSEKQRTVTNN